MEDNFIEVGRVLSAHPLLRHQDFPLLTVMIEPQYQKLSFVDRWGVWGPTLLRADLPAFFVLMDRTRKMLEKPYEPPFIDPGKDI